MRFILKIAIGIILLVSIGLLISLFYPEEVIAIRVEAKTTKQIIRDIFAEDGEDAIKIARCESGIKANAVNYEDSKLNGHVSRGLFQLSEINGKLENWQDPETNANAALQLYKSRGWKPWKNCAMRLGLL